MKLMRYLLHNFLMKCVLPALLVLPLVAVFPLTTSAHQQKAVPASTKVTECPQASANLDVTKLSEAQLQAYGLPVRPLNANAQTIAAWLQKANRIKTHHHVCQPSLLPASLEHHSRNFHFLSSTQSVKPNTVEINTPTWAGNYAIQPISAYVIADANWNLPCLSTSVRNAAASEWVGLGGGGNDRGYLVQTGTDEIVDSSGNVKYTAWYEDFGSPDYHSPTWTISAFCNDPVTAEVTSNLGGDGYDYYLLDVDNINVSQIEHWPVADGSTGECIVEDPNDGYPNFTDFIALTFTGCDMNNAPIGDYAHNYNNMYQNGHYLATTGPISNGSDYTITWRGTP